MIIIIENEEYYFDDNLRTYHNIRNYFNDFAVMAKRHFEEEYKKNLNNIDGLVNGIYRVAEQSIYLALSRCVDLMVKMGHLACSEQSLYDKYYEYLNFDQYYEPIESALNEVIMEKADLDCHRETEWNGRSRVVGAGFGISGFLKSQITAAAMNAVMDFGRTPIRWKVAAGDQQQCIQKICSIFKDKANQQRVFEGIYRCCINVLDVFEKETDGLKLNMASVNGCQNQYNFIRPDYDENEADIIFSNIKRNVRVLKKEDVCKYLMQAISKYPYKFDYYQYLIEQLEYNYLDKNIIEMIDFFGLESDYKKYVTSWLDKRFDDFLPNGTDSNEDVFKKYNKMKEILDKHLDASDFKPLHFEEVIEKYRHRAEELRIKANTYGGIEFRSYDECKAYRENDLKELKIFLDIVGKYNDYKNDSYLCRRIADELDLCSFSNEQYIKRREEIRSRQKELETYLESNDQGSLLSDVSSTCEAVLTMKEAFEGGSIWVQGCNEKIEIYIHPGCYSGQHVLIPNQGKRKNNHEQGHLLVNLVVQGKEGVTRLGNDIYTETTLNKAQFGKSGILKVPSATDDIDVWISDADKYQSGDTFEITIKDGGFLPYKSYEKQGDHIVKVYVV